MPGGTFKCRMVRLPLLSLDSGKHVNWKTVKTRIQCRCFLRLKQSSGTEIHHLVEGLTGNPL